jgi:hypothetical protein
MASSAKCLCRCGIRGISVNVSDRQAQPLGRLSANIAWVAAGKAGAHAGLAVAVCTAAGQCHMLSRSGFSLEQDGKASPCVM